MLAWGQPPSAVRASKAWQIWQFNFLSGFLAAAELRSAGQPRAAVPTWDLVFLIHGGILFLPFHVPNQPATDNRLQYFYVSNLYRIDRKNVFTE